MGENPSVIRAELEQTRQRVGDEIDALSYRTDVKARAGDYVEDRKDSVKSKLSSAKEAVMGVGGGMKEQAGAVGSSAGSALDTVGSAVPDREAVARRARGLRATAEHNPVGLAIGGLAVGFVIGTLLPSTRVENEHMGEMSDRLIDAARDTAQEAVERGKQVAQEAVGEAVETAKSSAGEQAQELTSSLQHRAEDATSA
jgi:hypothetical protein